MDERSRIFRERDNDAFKKGSDGGLTHPSDESIIADPFEPNMASSPARFQQQQHQEMTIYPSDVNAQVPYCNQF